VCDLDNEPTISVAQVHVTVDGQERTFDLCDKHLDAFRAAVAPFIPGGAGGTTAGRGRGRGAAKSTGRAAKTTGARAAKATGRVAKKATAKATAKATVAKARPGRPAKATRRPAAAGASDTAAVRAWAREQGIAVPERGRLGRDLIERYQQAKAGTAGA
jgi:hypothetical protein